MIAWIHVLAEQERRKDLLREVERERLVRQTLARHEGRVRFRRRALTWLGCRLVVWGQYLLQERYEPVVESPCA